MKVLSLQEPYATFIAKGHKLIETRSWKTNYRGELLIHASMSKSYINKINDEYILKLMDGIHFNYGKIICKARLVDCIPMTDDFIRTMGKNHKKEYLLGLYEPGRYAWVLENVELLEEPIEAKGQLNLWDFAIDD